jgi:hypothetical protein
MRPNCLRFFGNTQAATLSEVEWVVYAKEPFAGPNRYALSVALHAARHVFNRRLIAVSCALTDRADED